MGYSGARDSGMIHGLAAKLAGMSTRTLQRTLKASGYTYKRMLDECRFEHAK